MKLELIKHPSDWLSRKLDPWDFDNPPMDPVDMKKQMLKIMKANLGIGLSANQVELDGNIIDNNLLKITLNYSIPDNVENQIFEITTGGTTETGIY